MQAEDRIRLQHMIEATDVAQDFIGWREHRVAVTAACLAGSS